MPPDMIPAAASAQPYNPTQGVGMLSSILGIKQQQQQLQTGQYAQQAEQATAQQQQVAAQAAQGTNQFFSQWAPGDHIGDDGTLDINSAHQSDAYKNIPGVARFAVDQKLLDMKKAQIDNMQTMATMDNNTINDLARRSNTLSTDDDVKADNQAGRDKVAGMFQNYGKLGPEQAKIVSIFGKIADVAPKGKLSTAMASLGAQAQTVSEQQAQTNPKNEFVQTKDGLQGVNVNPNSPVPVGTPLGQPVKNATPPQLATLPNQQLGAVAAGGSSYTAVPQAGAGPPSSAPPASPATTPFRKPNGGAWTAQDTAPAPNAPKGTQDAYNASTQAAQQTVLDARGADKDYGINMSLADTIRRLSADTKTGPGTETWNRFMGTVGSRFGANNIANYQQLGAFLDNQASRLQQSMGLPTTNAGLSTAQTIGGNPGYQPAAIQAKNDYLQSLVEGVHQYSRGLDRVEGFTGQANPQAVASFQSAWRQNFDPRVYEAEQAANRSPDELKKFLTTLTPQAAADLRIKRQNLQKLTNGELPQ